MAITYNAGTNVITVTGYTEGTPCNFTDIYNADVAGGWGVITRLCTYMFCSSAHIEIGDGSTTTYLKDTSKTLYFTISAARFYIKANAHIQLGNKTATGGTKQGCTLFFSGASGSNSEFYIWGDAKLYKCKIATSGTAAVGHFILWIYSTNLLEVIDCDFERLWTWVFSTNPTTLVILRNIFSNSGTVIYPYTGVSITIDTLTVYDSSRPISMYRGDTLNATNIVSVGNDYFVDMADNATLNVYDSKLIGGDIWDRGSGWTINEYYHFDLKVIDKDETPINGATVKIWDKDSNLIVNTSTGAGGTITQQAILRDVYSDSLTPTLKTPHLIKIEKAGYTTYEADFTLEDKTNWLIALPTSTILRNPPMTGGMV
jgi:hypothetical protein